MKVRAIFVVCGILLVGALAYLAVATNGSPPIDHNVPGRTTGAGKSTLVDRD